MLKEGTQVKWSDATGCKAGTGHIRGVATLEQPTIGLTYIVHPDKPIEGYNYSHIVLFGVHLTKIVVDDDEKTLV